MTQRISKGLGDGSTPTSAGLTPDVALKSLLTSSKRILSPQSYAVYSMVVTGLIRVTVVYCVYCDVLRCILDGCD